MSTTSAAVAEKANRMPFIYLHRSQVIVKVDLR